MTVVLDASAVLALLQQEAGHATVRAALPGASLSTANLAEVLAKAGDRGLDPGGQTSLLEVAGVDVVQVTAQDAVVSAELRRADVAHGPPVLSLGDRLCLALGRRLRLPVLTADRAWLDVDVGCEVRLLR